jgi:glycosyltransferase involved in cell wall biosynthesis
MNSNISCFTVLISVYKNDKPALFYKSLKSIFDNSCKPHEVILVLDGPIGIGLIQIVDYFTLNHSLKVIRLNQNVGLAEALNFGLMHVTTDWTVRADSDDINLLGRFAQLKKYMNSSFDLVGSAIQEVNEDGMKLKVRRPPETEYEIREYLKSRNPFNHMSVCFRTDFVKRVGGYPNIYLREDYALWALLISNNARVYNIQNVLVNATAGKNMYKRRGGVRYALGEILLQKHLMKCGIKGRFLAFYHGLIRTLVFLMPSNMRAFIYEIFLRERS